MVISESHLISVKLIYSWDDVTTHLTGYKLKIKKVRENKLILDEIIPSTRKNMKVSGLLPSVKYKVDIATIRKERKSEFKTIAITTLPNPPKITGSAIFSRSTGVKMGRGASRRNWAPLSQIGGSIMLAFRMAMGRGGRSFGPF